MPRWRDHEKRSRRSSFFKGYKVQEQKHSRSTGRRPDFFAVSKEDPSERKIADVKYVKKLTHKNIQQVKRYKGHPFYVKDGNAAIFVKQSTKVTKDAKEEAKGVGIKIIRKYSRRDW